MYDFYKKIYDFTSQDDYDAHNYDARDHLRYIIMTFVMYNIYGDIIFKEINMDYFIRHKINKFNKYYMNRISDSIIRGNMNVFNPKISKITNNSNLNIYAYLLLDKLKTIYPILVSHIKNIVN